MNIEQKAKAYDKALERARAINNGETTGALGETVCEFIFPELKESKDEKIRKGLINGFNECLKNSQYSSNAQKYWHNIKIEDIFAWLEKQGEQNLIMAKSPQLGEPKPFDYEDANIQQKDFAPKSAMKAAKEKKIDNANKVEPKDYNSIDPHFGKPADKA